MLRGVLPHLLLVVALRSCSVTSSCINYDIRLVNGPTPKEGRVEICYDGIWGTVCDDFFDGNAAAVVCRQLQFTPEGAIARDEAFYGEGEGRIRLDDVQCEGNESRLVDCIHDPIDSHDCDHSEDVGVQCCPLWCQDGDIRLVGGDSSEQGRLEVCYNETWGTVCDNHFDEAVANVTCRQLNVITHTAHFYTDDRYGTGSGPIFLNNLQCVGTEQSLVDCTYDSHTADCNHTEDVGIWCEPVSICSEGDVRLVGGSNSLEGRVEVCRQNAWGTVCDDDWDIRDSAVVCNQLGFTQTDSIGYLDAHFGQGTGAIVMDDVQCVGTETALILCTHRTIHNCGHSEDAGVRCSRFVCSEGDVKLVGGSNSQEGRVEVCLQNTWGTVCDDDWGEQDSAVVCNQLGHSPTGSTVFQLAHSSQGSALPILMDDVACTGSESRLIDCKYDAITRDCGLYNNAGVRCNSGSTPTTPVVAVIASVGGVLIILTVIIVIAIVIVRRMEYKRVRIGIDRDLRLNIAPINEQASHLPGNHIYDTINEFKSTEEMEPELSDDTAVHCIHIPNPLFTVASTPLPALVPINEEQQEKQDGTMDDSKEGENPSQMKELKMADNDEYVKMRSA